MRALYLERHPAYTWEDHKAAKVRATKVAGYWLLPIHTNRDRTLGTFFRLYDDGKIEQVTVRADQGDEIVLIKPADA